METLNVITAITMALVITWLAMATTYLIVMLTIEICKTIKRDFRERKNNRNN